MGKKGIVFITVIAIAALMVIIGVGLSNMILQDTHMVRHLRRTTQAQLLAESGIHDALSTIVSHGFSSVSDATNFPQTNFGGGTFDVTAVQNAGRVLLRSVGICEGVSRTVSLEIKDNTPSALYYMMSAGTDLRIRTVGESADINGDVHANRNVRLFTLWGNIDIDSCGNDCCSGAVSAGNRVYTTEVFGSIAIAGDITQYAGMVSFPNFDYNLYMSQAQASGDYYSGDQDFGSVGATTNLSPSNGIIYVEGTARFYGTCNLNGGITASRIRVIGQLNQFKSGTKNVIIARGDNTVGDIEIFYRLEAEEAIVYAARDVTTVSAGSFVEVTGSLIASRNVRIWDFLTQIIYNHRTLYPDGLLMGTSGLCIDVLNWTQ